MKLDKYKNVIFDIGGVLAHSKSGYWFITPNFWHLIDKNIIDIDNLKTSMKKYMYLHTQEPKNEKEEHEMFKKYYYSVLKDINYPKLTEELCEKIADDCVYNDEKFIFYEDVKEILERLYKKHNLYIISNGWPSSFRVLKNYRIDHYFKDIIISSMYSTIKEESLFNIFLEKHLDVNSNKSLYIDDRRHILEKAKEYGFDVMLMDRDNRYSDEDFIKINDLKELERGNFDEQ